MDGTGPIGRLSGWHPELRCGALILLASLAFTLFYNNAFWGLLFSDRDILAGNNLLTFAALFVAVTAIQFAGLSLLLPRPLLRPILGLLFLCSALASFYMDHFGVFLNNEMLRNVLHSDPAEARELLTPALVPHLLLFAVVPVLLLWRVRIVERPLKRALGARLATVALVLVVAGLAVFTQYRDVSTLVRSHRDSRHLVTPTNYLASLFRIVRDANAAPSGAPAVIAADARRTVMPGPQHRPQLLVLAIGETVRSANFGLSGYARQTTPELAALDLAVFPRVQACGTSTEVSLPCMFAPVGRRDYDEERILGQESLLDVLQRVGLQVRWIDNQSGCKGVCKGVPTERIAGNTDRTLCDGEHCLDEILLSRLADQVTASSGDMVIVLHMLGNHGPAYSHRYPPAFRKFTPTCESLDINECTPQEIVNAYDNAVLYTDHVLARLVAYLQAITDRDTGLIYLSDHGESLGENGLYLHGLPYRIAPAVQREVPMLVWLSPSMHASTGIDPACLQTRATQPTSHDHFFHSVLGLMQVSSATREPGLDVFAACRHADAIKVAKLARSAD